MQVEKQRQLDSAQTALASNEAKIKNSDSNVLVGVETEVEDQDRKLKPRMCE
jgi:hypothetical protein